MADDTAVSRSFCGLVGFTLCSGLWSRAAYRRRGSLHWERRSGGDLQAFCGDARKSIYEGGCFTSTCLRGNVYYLLYRCTALFRGMAPFP